MDHPGQPRRGLRAGHRLPADRGRRGGGGSLGARRASGWSWRPSACPRSPATAGILTHTSLVEFDGAALAGSVARHPLRGLADGYDFDVPLLPGDFVTTEQGTGLVHIAPSHGEDDFELGARHGLDVPGHGGRGRHLHRGGAGLHRRARVQGGRAGDRGAARRGDLLARGTLVHSYPHSWRSKAPLIFRATAQWFIPMEGADHLRDKALAAIDATRWVPARGRNRIRAMIETRPDWCVSRQRAWGVPIAVFVHKATGEVLRDPEVVERIARAFEEEGADAWWMRDPQEFLGNALRRRRLREGRRHPRRLVR